MDTKRCSRCNNFFPLSKFHKNKRMKDGHNAWCKSCIKDWSKENSDNRKNYYHRYYLENIEKKKTAASDWYYNNHDKAVERGRNYYLNNKDKWIEIQRTEKWKIDHRKRAKIQKAKRRNLGFIKLWDNPFPPELEIDWHHISDSIVVPIPRKIHSICSNPHREEHRERCNV